jgi:glycosyltransferase involved in cell wall biosynthesis
VGREEKGKEVRIVVPYRDVLGRSIDSNVTSGGIERFIRHLRDELDDVRVVDVSELYYPDPTAMRKLVEEACENADLLICNYPNRHLNYELSGKLPILWINHHTAGLHPLSNEIACHMSIHVKEGNRLWMVSKKQARDWIEFGKNLGFKITCHGIIQPSMVHEVRDHSGEFRWDAVTVGRCDEIKNPFLLHEVAERARMRSLVMCGYMANEYCTENQDWMGYQTTGWNYSDAKLSAELSRCGVFLVTWPEETFGIAALEALAHGLPLVLYAPSGSHACEELIPGSPWIFSARSKDEIAPALRRMMEITPRERILLASTARAMHSANAWRRKLKEMIG